MGLVYFEEIQEFTKLQQLQALFFKVLKLRLNSLTNNKTWIYVYDVNGKFLDSFIVPNELSDNAMRELINQLNMMATNQP